jgi:glycosyltransferase involved in cell wall biosynthesis
MGLGLPVVATAVGGAPEIIAHGATGWLLDDTSPSALARALKVAFQLGPATLRRIGSDARASVIGRFAPDAYVERLEALYSRLLDRAAEGQE